MAGKPSAAVRIARKECYLFGNASVHLFELQNYLFEVASRVPTGPSEDVGGRQQCHALPQVFHHDWMLGSVSFQIAGGVLVRKKVASDLLHSLRADFANFCVSSLDTREIRGLWEGVPR